MKFQKIQQNQQTDVVTKTFIFNIILVILFSIIYTLLPENNFKSIKPKHDLTYLDFLFYSTTIQAGVGLPDITAYSPLATFVALIQQIIKIGSVYFLLLFFFNKNNLTN